MENIRSACCSKANFLSLLVLAKKLQCSACSQMLAKTIRHPSWSLVMSWLDRPVASLGLNLLCCNINTGGTAMKFWTWRQKARKLMLNTSWPLKSIRQGAAPSICVQTSAVWRVRLCSPTLVHISYQLNRYQHVVLDGAFSDWLLAWGIKGFH